MQPKGTLIAIGGNEDKGMEKAERYTLDFIEAGILRHVVNQAGGKNAKIEVITTASSIPDQVGEKYLYAFDKLGCTNVSVLDIRSRAYVRYPDYLRRIEEADCVMFSGGDQRRLSQVFRNTSILETLTRRYQEENFVIAGTSAGAVAMSKEMISGGSSQRALLKGALMMEQGLSFLPNVVLDSHFIWRGRFGRLAEAVAIYPQLLGIGLGEDTGIVVTKGDEFKVIGSGMIILFDGTKLSHNNVPILEEGTPISIGNLTVHVLANSDRFSIKERKLEVLPIDAEYI